MLQMPPRTASHPLPHRCDHAGIHPECTPVTLYAMSGAFWMTDEGGIYSESMNGVLHCMSRPMPAPLPVPEEPLRWFRDPLKR